jgi:arylsulfatase A-like enzyme
VSANIALSGAIQPDIVLVHAHDLGRWLTVYGNASSPTPRLQEFAERSIVFDDAHASAPLCSPSRGSLFTGLSPHRHGIQGLTHLQWRYREGVRTIPEVLREFGYRSMLIGLQHENVDASVLGFDEVRGAGFLPRGHQVVDDAIKVLPSLPKRADRDPLFLTIGMWEVHRPWPAEDYEPADPTEVAVPAYLPDNADTRADIAAFHGSIAYFDAAIGRLLDAVDRDLDPATTMVVFTTDHGVAFPRAKGTLYDAGTGVSLIIRPPTSWGARSRRSSSLVAHVDLLPTFIDLAGGEPDPQLEGMSLVPELLGTPELAPDRVLVTEKTYHNHYDPIRAVRTSDFVYIRNFVDNPKLTLSADLENSRTRQGMGDAHLEPRPAEELFDRRKDPQELDDVASVDAYAQVREEYSRLLQEWMLATDDPVRHEVVPTPPRRSRETDALPPVAPVISPRLSASGAGATAVGAAVLDD